ncbi:MAG: hypothetical protein SF123_18775 [Chloroflexota bacterium]|nr:hypothetical protein [Chloroflexota bacterium]
MSRIASDTVSPIATGAAKLRAHTALQIMPTEWRWLIVAASLLTLVAFAPLIWFAIQGTGDSQFMGTLMNPVDGGTYLSKMQIGFRGGWLVTFQHTPEIHSGAFIQVIYPFLGHLSRLTGIPIQVMFHIARLGAALFMYIALYQFGAAVWSKVRARRLFFLIVSLGAGFGLALQPLFQTTDFPDLTLPEAFPFFSSLMNVHFPLTIGLLALLGALLIVALRPGAESDNTADRALPLAALTSLGLAIIFPQTLAPLGAALVLYVGFDSIKQRRISKRLIAWLLTIGLPALPLFIYYMLVVSTNPAMATWNQQNQTLAPPVHIYLLGFGLPIILALPGIWRALRRFEADGDRLMLLWLLAMMIATFLPTNIQRRFSAGIMIPIAYFATRAIEDVWLRYISRRRRNIAFALAFAIMPISLGFVLSAPVIGFAINPQSMSAVLLDRNYVAAFAWLRPRVDSNDVVLASPTVSIWIPAYADGRVVYAHPYETLNAQDREMQVATWFSTEATPEQCRALLEAYSVRYILVGPQERTLGDSPCIDSLTEIAEAGSVSIYAP